MKPERAVVAAAAFAEGRAWESEQAIFSTALAPA